MLFICCVIKFNTGAKILTNMLALQLDKVWIICQDPAPENSIAELLSLDCWNNPVSVLFNLTQRENLSPYSTAAPTPSCQ